MVDRSLSGRQNTGNVIEEKKKKNQAQIKINISQKPSVFSQGSAMLALPQAPAGT